MRFMTISHRAIYVNKHNFTSILVVALLGSWHTFVVPFLDDTQPIGRIAKFIPLAVIVFSMVALALTKYRRRMPSTVFKLFLLLCVLVLYRITVEDFASALDVIMFFGGVAAFWLLAQEVPLNLHALNYTLLLIVLPGAIIYHRFLGMFSNFEFDIIPFVGADWRVLIRAHHHSAMVGCYLLLINIMLYRSQNHHRGWRVAFACLGLYFVIFSGSRAVFLVVVLILVSVFLNRFPRWLFFIGPIITVALLYIVLSTPLINNLRMNGSMGVMLKLDPQNIDPSAGRAWLWQYHINLFIHHPWRGTSEAESFGFGDIVNGLRVIASTESFFTYVLARYGIGGIVYIFFFLWCLWKPLTTKRFDAYLWGMLIFVLTMSLSLNATTYSFFSIVNFWMFFSLLQQKRLDPSPTVATGLRSNAVNVQICLPGVS